MRLLLVEDEEDLAAMAARGLRREGYAVDIAEDGEMALEYYEINSYDLIVLDLNLPKLDGLEVLKYIRSVDARMKVLILSARSRVEERVMGLDMGANDYLAKPFDFIELMARVRALLRLNLEQPHAVLCCGRLELDTAARQARLGENEITLTKKEYGVLEYLAYHCGRVISAEELVEHVWDEDADPFSNSLKYHIHCLKKKLVAAGAEENTIANLRGQGYVLRGDKK